MSIKSSRETYSRTHGQNYVIALQFLQVTIAPFQKGQFVKLASDTLIVAAMPALFSRFAKGTQRTHSQRAVRKMLDTIPPDVPGHLSRERRDEK